MMGCLEIGILLMYAFGSITNSNLTFSLGWDSGCGFWFGVCSRSPNEIKLTVATKLNKIGRSYQLPTTIF